MLEKLKQMMQAFLAGVGDGSALAEVELSSSYVSMGDDATVLQMSWTAEFMQERREQQADIPPARDGEVH
jgi:hypothetical protein